MGQHTEVRQSARPFSVPGNRGHARGVRRDEAVHSLVRQCALGNVLGSTGCEQVEHRRVIDGDSARVSRAENTRVDLAIGEHRGPEHIVDSTEERQQHVRIGQVRIESASKTAEDIVHTFLGQREEHVALQLDDADPPGRGHTLAVGHACGHRRAAKCFGRSCHAPPRIANPFHDFCRSRWHRDIVHTGPMDGSADCLRLASSSPTRACFGEIVAKLIYIANVSLDGYIEDVNGSFDWGVPSEPLHRMFSDLERPIGTYLYGRRLYETMAYWDSPKSVDNQPEYIRDFAAIWRAADKIVYSTTMQAAPTERTRIEREFEADAVRRIKAADTRDMTIGGATLAAQAMRAGLVDELSLVVWPVILGGGKSALPADIRMRLELVDERRFADGVVYLHYRVAKPSDES